jgi:hypothetical protein
MFSFSGLEEQGVKPKEHFVREAWDDHYEQATRFESVSYHGKGFSR